MQESECADEELICQIEIGLEGEEVEVCTCPVEELECADEELICQIEIGPDGEE